MYSGVLSTDSAYCSDTVYKKTRKSFSSVNLNFHCNNVGVDSLHQVGANNVCGAPQKKLSPPRNRKQTRRTGDTPTTPGGLAIECRVQKGTRSATGTAGQ